MAWKEKERKRERKAQLPITNTISAKIFNIQYFSTSPFCKDKKSTSTRISIYSKCRHSESNTGTVLQSKESGGIVWFTIILFFTQRIKIHSISKRFKYFTLLCRMIPTFIKSNIKSFEFRIYVLIPERKFELPHIFNKNLIDTIIMYCYDYRPCKFIISDQRILVHWWDRLSHGENAIRKAK